MNYTFQHIEAHDVLLVNLIGAYAFSDDLHYLRDLHRTYEESCCDRILLDYREADVEIGILEAFGRPDIYESFDVSDRPKKIGIVCRKITENYRFFENVCRNRGWNIRVYDDFNVANRWITDVGPA